MERAEEKASEFRPILTQFNNQSYGNRFIFNVEEIRDNTDEIIQIIPDKLV